jgi:hypothetical protein
MWGVSPESGAERKALKHKGFRQISRLTARLRGNLGLHLKPLCDKDFRAIADCGRFQISVNLGQIDERDHGASSSG